MSDEKQAIEREMQRRAEEARRREQKIIRERGGKRWP